MTPRRTDTAQRIVREAMRLFAEKGYERTSIADIQDAAGLRPGSGALYRHFPSKEAVLRAGLAEFVERERRVEEAIAHAPGPAPEALLALGQVGLRMLEEERDAIRILWRELDAFPQLRDEAREGRMQAAYRAVGAWLADRAARGELRVDDPEAAAAVVVGSLTMFRVFESLLGVRAVPVSDERFLRAWHAVMVGGMGTSEGR